MTRRRRPAPARSAGPEDGATDASLDHLEAEDGDEAVAILAEDAFEGPHRAGPDPGGGTYQERAAAVLALLARQTRLFATWCLVVGEAGWVRAGRWRHRAGLWTRDTLTVAVAWTVTAAVALGLRTRTAWRLYREHWRERRAARLANQRAARETAAVRALGTGQAGPDEATPSPHARGLTLREAALSAWGSELGQRAAREAEAQQRRTARDANALRRLASSRLGLQITPASGVVDVDGLRLGVIRGDQANDYALVLFSTCPACGAPVASPDIRGLADLGEAVDEVNARRNLCEECGTDADAGDATVEARLVGALREMLGEDGLYTLAGPAGAPARGNGSAAGGAEGTGRGNSHAGPGGRRDRGPAPVNRRTAHRMDRES